MKRLLLLTLAAAVAMSLVAIMGVRSFDGGTASAQGRTIELDLDEDTGWCNDIDATDTVTIGGVHQAAVCIVGSGPAVAALDFVVNFDNTKNTCANTGQTGTALDANPNFVALGTGWDCSVGGNLYPYCNVNNNEDPPVTTSTAYMLCTTSNDRGRLQGTRPLPSSPGRQPVPAPMSCRSASRVSLTPTSKPLPPAPAPAAWAPR